MDEPHDDGPAATRPARGDVTRLLDEAWAALHATLLALVDHPPAPTANGVTAGAAVMHVARWDEASVELFRAWAVDRAAPDPYSEHDTTWNALWLAQDVDIDIADALPRAEEAHRAFRATLAELDDDAWHAYGHDFATGTTEHYRSHAERPLELPLPAVPDEGRSERS